MYNFKTLKCCNCNAVIANLPETEIKKLNGVTFFCDCCSHTNLLKGFRFQSCLRENAILKEQIIA